MSAVRRHLVAVLAVVLGLAVGIVLGAGPLSSGASRSTEDGHTTEAEQESADPVDDGSRDALLEAVSGRSYGGALDRTPVTLVSLPGVDDQDASGLASEIERAGGVPTTVALSEGLVDPGQRTLVDTLGRQLVEQVDGIGDGVDELPTYELFGRLLGRGLATREIRGEASDADAESVLVSGETAELLQAPDEVRRAPYLVVLLPNGSPSEVDPILTGLVAGVSEQARGTVVVSPARDVAMQRLRDRTGADGTWERVTTVDADTGTVGWVTATLALVGWPDTRGRAYGDTGADGIAWMD